MNPGAARLSTLAIRFETLKEIAMTRLMLLHAALLLALPARAMDRA